MKPSRLPSKSASSSSEPATSLPAQHKSHRKHVVRWGNKPKMKINTEQSR